MCRLFCRHKWAITHAQYSPPHPNVTVLNGASPEFWLEMSLGVTVFIERCEHCRKYKTHRVYGRVDQEALA
jgi:hypothetical protein